MKTKNHHNFRKALAHHLPNILLALFITIVALGLYDCPVNAIFNIPCPGCGMTEACFNLLKLDIKGALSANYLFFIPILWAFYYVFLKRKHSLSQKTEAILLIVSVSLFFIRWISILFFI